MTTTTETTPEPTTSPKAEPQGHVHGPDCSHDHDHAHHPHDAVQPFVRATPKLGRNDPCLCGSGQKFKKCCGK